MDNNFIVTKENVAAEISQLNRADNSQENISKARSLLKLTGTATRYCILFIKNRKEVKTPWFESRERAIKALTIFKAKGVPAMIYSD